MIRPTRLLVLLSLLATVTFRASANEWDQFRGPTGQGVSVAESLPTSWSETEHVKWKTPINGDGWSSPVVSGDRIFVTTAEKIEGESDKSRSLRAVCLDARNGQTLWNHEVFRLVGEKIQIHQKNSNASPTPILDDDRLFVHFGPAGTACLSTDGEIIWKMDSLGFKPVHGNGGSPALYQDTLIITCDGADRQFVAGISAETGDIRWKTPRQAEVKKGFSFCTPTVITVDGRSQAICPGSGAVVAYDPNTGKELWHINYDQGYSVVPRPVYANGLVFVSSGYDSATLYAIDPTGAGDVTETHVRWTVSRNVPKTPSMLVVGDELYYVDDGGVATCVDSTTGKPHWKERLGGKYSASLFYGGRKIYFQSESGKTTIINPGKDYDEVATNQIGEGERTFASFAVVDDDLLLRSENHLYRIGG